MHIVDSLLALHEAARAVAAKPSVGGYEPLIDGSIPQEYWANYKCPEEDVAEWRRNLDLEAFGRECRAIERELKDQQGQEDLDHLQGVLNWSLGLYWAGVGLAAFCDPMAWNPLAAVLISTATMARWTMVGHHVCHGGYSREQTTEERFHRRFFARGLFRRIYDWLDWMAPEAWDAEHNKIHHYMLGETADPDLVERNFLQVRAGNYGPGIMKYLAVGFLMATWKWFYYAPNTLKELFALEKDRAEKRGEERHQPFTTGAQPTTVTFAFEELFRGRVRPAVEMAKCMLPYMVMQFMVIPAAVGGVASLFVGAAAGAAVGQLVLLNMVVAEVLTNIHSFVIIATNHVGNDIYRFATPVKAKTGEFYLRAIIGSANFCTGGKVNADGSYKPAGVRGNVLDYMQGWLNYQIEHHMFDSLSMLSYQKAQPKVKALCEKHGVPYVQQNVFKRLQVSVDVMVGKTDMIQWESGK